MSIRHNPFEEMERLFDRLSRRLEESGDWWEDDETSPGLFAGMESMAVDMVEHDDEFVVTVDLPGFERDEVDVTVTDHTLRIEADLEESMAESEENYLRRERRESSQRRSLRLSAEVDAEAVSAKMRNGVLTVTLPKREVEEATTIEIE